MKLPVVWLPDAYAELTEALAYHEAIRSDLAERFATAVEETVGAIAAAPSRFAVVDKERRRAGVRRLRWQLR